LYRYPCVAKGFNAVETGEIIAKKWQMFKHPVCVGLDAKRFDQHISMPALKFTHGIYRKFIKNAEFSNLLDKMLINHGVGTAKDGRVKYKVRGCRMSGDMDTALGNCTIMVLMTRNLCLKLNIPHELMNNGDDCIVMFDQQYLQVFNSAVKPYFKSLGFNIKVEEPRYTLERVEFCQTHPVYDGEKWRMVRLLTAIAKDCATVINWEQLTAWWAAIGKCGLAVLSGMPIYTNFYRWLIRIGKVGGVERHPVWKNEGLRWYTMGLDLSGQQVITDEARLSFAAAFGVTPQMQEALEGIYDELGEPGVMAMNPNIFESAVVEIPDRISCEYFHPDIIDALSLQDYHATMSVSNITADLLCAATA
ncbi:RNA-dependent RNA polymerase, partial [Tobacco mottle virus]